MTDSDSADPPSRTKVGRLIGEYGLDGIGEEFERRWTGQSGERDSLRTLADAFNERLLERAMRDAGMDPLEGEVENVYRLLTDEDVSRGVETEVTARLEGEGVDVERLMTDFVTYQAIRTFLKDVRGAEYEADDGDSVERARSSFARLVGRTTAVVEQKLTQLRSSDELTLGSFRVRTAITVYCEDCETQYEVDALLNAGGCECESGD
ncbi:rod-determining factor RdfA [Halobium salinum]|uniref:Rod-determining factor RdfA n=1 Tax=Halobium salinum TaxID=1364940 RepID=A0ABD5PHT9_9EURY|nr:rod-determining factor RdfA [Halobium salinum]